MMISFDFIKKKKKFGFNLPIDTRVLPWIPFNAYAPKLIGFQMQN
jgi:hypothetical protein